MNQEQKGQIPEDRKKRYRTVIGGMLVAAVAMTAVVAAVVPWLSSLEDGDDSLSAQESSLSAEESLPSDTDKEAREPEPDANLESDPIPEKTADAESAEAETTETTAGAEPDDEAESVMPEVIAWTAFDPAEMNLLWPVSGVVVKNYSTATLIYDATLDQYATNDSISISAETEEAVLAAADGVVKEVGLSDRLGYYVVLDNGNGYETTYGQLSENVAVTVGDTVLSGQTLGRIAAPSWYSVALGTHLTFSVSFGGTSVNPLDYLENVLDD